MRLFEVPVSGTPSIDSSLLSRAKAASTSSFLVLLGICPFSTRGHSDLVLPAAPCGWLRGTATAMPAFVRGGDFLTETAFRRCPLVLAALRPIAVDDRCDDGRCGLTNAPRVPGFLTRRLLLPIDLEVDRPPSLKPWRVLCVQHSLLSRNCAPGALGSPAISRDTCPRFEKE